MGFKLEHTIAAKTKKESSQKGLEGLLKKEITLFGDFFNNKRKEDFYSEFHPKFDEIALESNSQVKIQ